MLESISQVQQQFPLGGNPRRSFEAMLDILKESTNSEFGFIGEVMLSEDGKPYHMDWLRRIQQAGLRAKDILRRPAEFVRANNSERVRCGVSDMIDRALELVSWRLVRQRILVDYQAPPRDVCCEVDRVQIEQVVLNLLNNGCDAIREAGIADGRLAIRVNDAVDSVELVVEDNGPGIADEIREKLFLPFATTKDHGMGLGLAICRSIIDDHRGRIWATNSPAGAEFHVVLPKRQGDNMP